MHPDPLGVGSTTKLGVASLALPFSMYHHLFLGISASTRIRFMSSSTGPPHPLHPSACIVIYTLAMHPYPLGVGSTTKLGVASLASHALPHQRTAVYSLQAHSGEVWRKSLGQHLALRPKLSKHMPAYPRSKALRTHCASWPRKQSTALGRALQVRRGLLSPHGTAAQRRKGLRSAFTVTHSMH